MGEVLGKKSCPSLTAGPFFRAYVDYARSSSEALAFLGKVRKRSQLKKFLDATAAQLGFESSEHLETLLQAPLLRLPRYTVLVGQVPVTYCSFSMRPAAVMRMLRH